MKITVVCGNPKADSRTLSLAQEFVDDLAGAGHPRVVIDLADHAHEVVAWPSPGIDAIMESVVQADLVVVATPTYKSTYTGLLKAFLDRCPSDGLRETVAAVVFTGGGLQHSMAPSTTLLPVLTELGATVIDGGLFFDMSHYDARHELVAGYAHTFAGRLARVHQLSEALRVEMQEAPEL